MPLNFITVDPTAFDWQDVRQTIADCVKFAVDPVGAAGAMVYPHWVYEIDVQSMLGKVTGDMRSRSGTSINKVHCWTLGVSAAMFEKNQAGVPDMMGGGHRQWQWILTLDVWGFFEDDGKKESQQNAENEARLVSATLWRNAEVIQSGVGEIAKITPLEFPNVQPSPFAGGEKVIVASGLMQVYVRETLAA